MDGFIDYIIPITIDNPWWVERANNAALLVIHTIFRPLHYDEPPKQYGPLLLRKLVGEHHIEKRKTSLGWYIQTRSIRVLLTIENYAVWLQDIR